MALRIRKAQQVQNTLKTPASTKLTNDDELVKTIKRVFQEEFEILERKINGMIKCNMELANKRLAKISAEVIKVTKCFELTQKKLDEDLKSIKKDITKMKSEMKELTEDLPDPNPVDLEGIIFELMELLNNQMKLGEECEEKVVEVIKDKLNIEKK